MLKTNGKRELSLDDMGKVSGGIGSENKPRQIYLGGEYYDEATFNTVILSFADSYGNDAALEFAQELTGYPFIIQSKINGGIRQALDDFWGSVEMGKFMGH